MSEPKPEDIARKVARNIYEGCWTAIALDLPCTEQHIISAINEATQGVPVTELRLFLSAIINSERDFMLPNGSRIQHAAANLIEALASKGGDATCPANQSFNTNTELIPQGSSAAPKPFDPPSDAAELLPCPFCGGKPESNGVDGCEEIRCMKCGARTDWNGNHEAAAGRWNTRAALAQSEADKKRLDWLEKPGHLGKMVDAMNRITAERMGRGPSVFWREAIDAALAPKRPYDPWPPEQGGPPYVSNG